MTDPIADMLTRIRNANNAGHLNEKYLHRTKKSNCSNITSRMLHKAFDIKDDGKQGILTVDLKYLMTNKRISED
jgi:small subunit ribosomal protein S8